jgi:hypothetical protein
MAGGKRKDRKSIKKRGAGGRRGEYKKVQGERGRKR